MDTTWFMEIRNQAADLAEAHVSEGDYAAAVPALSAGFIIIAIQEATRQIVNAINEAKEANDG